MKTMCHAGSQQNDFAASHVLGYKMYGSILLVPINKRLFIKLWK